MFKICIFGVLQQQAEALGTQIQPINAFFNSDVWNTNIKEMKSSKNVNYIPYTVKNRKEETLEFLRIIERNSPDFIYINSVKQLFYLGITLKSQLHDSKKPLIIGTSHNSRVWKSKTKRLIMAFIFLFFTDGILTLAKFQEYWLRKYGIASSKIRTISNPVDINLFSPNVERSKKLTNNITLLNIGEINPLKNQEVLILALKYVLLEYPNVELFFTGGRLANKNYDNYLKKIIHLHQVEKNIKIIGYTEHQKVPNLLHQADISLVPSKSEVCPFVVLESLATGTVTIASEVGGIPDLIQNNKNGFLVDPNDANGFSKKILSVINDSDLRERIEINARKSAINQFSYEVIGKKHIDFLSSLI